ncbi:MAG: succinate dehydrogenase/fumarate reductase transmembrane subunit [Candidatus Dormibacteraceae bacterium]
MTGPAETSTAAATRSFAWSMPVGWWTRKRHYILYVVREFTALPLALWLIWLLIEIKRAGDGPTGYVPHGSTPFVIFSVICLLFALYHSVTFLSLSGLIIRIKVLDRQIPSRMITAAMFALWALASIVIAAVLIGFAR